jgi:hypothetical protein
MKGRALRKTSSRIVMVRLLGSDATGDNDLFRSGYRPRTFIRVLHLGQSGASASRRDFGFSCDTIGGAPEL